MQLPELYNNDCIFDKFECCFSGDGLHFATGSYRFVSFNPNAIYVMSYVIVDQFCVFLTSNVITKTLPIFVIAISCGYSPQVLEGRKGLN